MKITQKDFRLYHLAYLAMLALPVDCLPRLNGQAALASLRDNIAEFLHRDAEKVQDLYEILAILNKKAKTNG